MRLLHPLPGLHWTEMRNCAESYVSHGWCVVPGTYQFDDLGTWFGRQGARDLAPITENWEDEAVQDPSHAVEVWTRRPYNILLPCGMRVTGIHVDREIRDVALNELDMAGLRGPVIAAPKRTAFVLARGGAATQNLTELKHLTFCGHGCWLPLPPTAIGGRVYRWMIAPGEVNWQLPPADEVLEVLGKSAPIPPNTFGPSQPVIPGSAAA